MAEQTGESQESCFSREIKWLRSYYRRNSLFSMTPLSGTFCRSGTGTPKSAELDHGVMLPQAISGCQLQRGRLREERNPTLRLWSTIFAGESDVPPSQRRHMGQEIG